MQSAGIFELREGRVYQATYESLRILEVTNPHDTSAMRVAY